MEWVQASVVESFSHATVTCNTYTIKYLILLTPTIINRQLKSFHNFVAWGSTSKRNLQKIQTKKNHVVWVMFFATLSRKNTDSALPFLNILELLTVTNVYRHALKLTLYMHGTKVFCPNSLTIFSSMPATYIIITPGVWPVQNLPHKF